MIVELKTPRLKLRHWRVVDADEFAALHADPDVNADLGGLLAAQNLIINSRDI